MENKKVKCRYGFIGVGHMASAIANSLIENGVAGAGDLMMYDIDGARVDAFEVRGVKRAADGREITESCEYVILAVQPYQMKACLESIKEADISPETALVSIAASVTTEYIMRVLGRDMGVIRLMPNMPMMIGKGAVAAARNTFVSDEKFDALVDDLGRISVVSVVDETLMNAVVPVSGSSPAYVYLFVKAMLEGAESVGLAPDVAEPLILQTIEGAIGIIRREQTSMDALINKVCTPGGTTVAAMSSFEKSDFTVAVKNAMQACMARAEELAAALERN